MRKLLLVLLCLGLMGCATDINKITDNYAESSAAVKLFAKVTAADWLFGSGIIQGALPEDAVPAWVFAELRKVDEWFEAGEPLTETQLGYMVGVRLRLAGPIIESAIKVYAPGIMGIAQVTTVLAFLGL